ncbi:MAG: hypothetical protein RR928_01910, partial [Comamonas sp.]
MAGIAAAGGAAFAIAGVATAAVLVEGADVASAGVAAVEGNAVAKATMDLPPGRSVTGPGIATLPLAGALP